EIVLAQAKSIIDSWGKLTVLAKDTPGFIVNRVARPFYGEALRILEENVATAATIDWAMTEIGGFKMGPFTLMDYIGHDVNYTVTETVFKAFYYDDRYKPSFTQKRLAEAGYLGRKTGKGFYDYSENAPKPEPNKDEELGKYIVNRIVMMLINEAADALFLNIATRDDIDTAMTKGVNYPKGLLKWADEFGIQNVVVRLDAMFDDYRESRYRCSPLLRRMARNKVTFYS
ncbi:MAG: 3-hydroxyacyl-CoA dehydrogenase family protein, partial [Saprospiraceae bacterium]